MADNDDFRRSLLPQTPIIRPPDTSWIDDIDWEDSHPAVTRRAAEQTAAAVQALLENTQAAEKRERQMLRWARVSAVAATAAALIGILALLITHA